MCRIGGNKAKVEINEIARGLTKMVLVYRCLIEVFFELVLERSVSKFFDNSEIHNKKE